MKLPQNLPALLLPWYETEHRDLPWRHTKEPYAVWLSEIMLQQTRAAAVIGYYHRFLEALPTVEALAGCPEEQLFKLWEGLGYYSRVRNLQKAARQIMERFEGHFPTGYAEIRSLAGIGDYTAAAIFSICFGGKTPAVDGNLLRVCARLSGNRMDIRLPAAKQEVTEALSGFDAVDYGKFNQALMELGAVICLPHGAPDCVHCPVAGDCAARDGLWRELPVKSPRPPRETEERSVFILQCAEKFAIERRPGKGLLAGLWELPNTLGMLAPQEAFDFAAALGCAPERILREQHKTHIFTHKEWHMRGYTIECSVPSPRFVWVNRKELAEAYALPTAFRIFLED